MPWDQDPVLAVIGAILLLAMVGGALALIGILGYITWDQAPNHPVYFGVMYGVVFGVFALVWLLRSRCPRCKRFFVARRTGTEVDHVPTPVTVAGRGSQMQVSADRVVIIRHYQCRRCGARFSRRS